MTQRLLFREGRHRVNRAHSHAKTFIDLCEIYVSENPHTIIHEMKNYREGIIKALPTQPFPHEAQLVLGEFFYQLRAALDSLIWEAYTHFGGSENAPDAKHLYFPIFSEKRDFKNAAFHKIPLPDKLTFWLKAIQSCYADEPLRTADEAAICNAVTIINNCAKFDRHRHLPVIAVVRTFNESELIDIEVGPAPAYLAHQSVFRPNSLDEQFVLATFSIGNPSPVTELHAKGYFSFELATPTIRPEPGAGMDAQLRHLCTVVRLIIQTFSEAFGEDC